MSASSFSLPHTVANSAPRPPLPSRTRMDPRLTRRAPTPQQGRALEALGHAVEYLIDTRMFLVDEPRSLAEGEAIRLLSSCSREVFGACPEVVPVSQRLKTWATAHLHLHGHVAAR